MKNFIFTMALALLVCPIFANNYSVPLSDDGAKDAKVSSVTQRITEKLSKTFGDNIAGISFRVTAGNSECTKNVTVIVTVNHGANADPQYTHKSITYYDVPCDVDGGAIGQGVKKRTEKRLTQ
jgi:hypothetical protein